MAETTTTTPYIGDSNKIINSSYLYETLQDFKTEHVDTKVDKVEGKGLSTNDYTSTEKTKLSGIATGAEVNQNAFSNITVGSTTIAADSKTDTLTLVAGSNITLTPDATNDKITIASTDTKYTHPSYTAKTSGLYKVTVDGTGHVSAASAVTKEDITALGIPGSDTNTITTCSTTGNGNAITAISATNGAITATKGATFLTAHPSITAGTNTTTTASPAFGGSFTAIGSLTKDTNGHVTAIETKTVTLPSLSFESTALDLSTLA